MNRIKIFTPAAAVVALVLVGVPVQAQHGGGGHGGGGGGHSSGGARQAAAPRSAGGAGAVRGGATGATGVGVPRGSVRSPYYGGRFYGNGFGYALGAPYYAFRPRVSLGLGLWLGYPIAYPYWAFPDPYVYGDPYGYPGYGYAYPGYGNPGYGYPGYGYGAPAYGGYPAPNRAYGNGAPPADPNTVTASPGTTATDPNAATAEPDARASAQGQYGGLSFQITPANAAVLVDGVYVGTASQFTATTQPLTLTPGRHHVEMRAEGYEPMSFDVNVAPGQVLPYQGTLQAR
jgi:hypothetical protein